MEIGDVVKVKKGLLPRKVYDGVMFNKDMMRFCGKEVEIREVKDNKCLIVGSNFVFSEGMFDLA